jgi:hypothetical protein
MGLIGYIKKPHFILSFFVNLEYLHGLKPKGMYCKFKRYYRFSLYNILV